VFAFLLLSNRGLPDERHGQLFGELPCGWRPLQRIVEPCPQVSENEQLLAQQCRQIGKRSVKAEFHPQVLQDQHGDQSGLDLRLDRNGAGAQERLHFCCMFQRTVTDALGGFVAFIDPSAIA
jgi:hypothetical protein